MELQQLTAEPAGLGSSAPAGQLQVTDTDQGKVGGHDAEGAVSDSDSGDAMHWPKRQRRAVNKEGFVDITKVQRLGHYRRHTAANKGGKCRATTARQERKRPHGRKKGLYAAVPVGDGGAVVVRQQGLSSYSFLARVELSRMARQGGLQPGLCTETKTQAQLKVLDRRRWIDVARRQQKFGLVTLEAQLETPSSRNRRTRRRNRRAKRALTSSSSDDEGEGVAEEKAEGEEAAEEYVGKTLSHRLIKITLKENETMALLSKRHGVELSEMLRINRDRFFGSALNPSSKLRRGYFAVVPDPQANLVTTVVSYKGWDTKSLRVPRQIWYAQDAEGSQHKIYSEELLTGLGYNIAGPKIGQRTAQQALSESQIVWGTVLGFLPQQPGRNSEDWWHVLHNDGDREDLDEGQLTHAIRLAEELTQKQQQQQTTKAATAADVASGVDTTDGHIAQQRTKATAQPPPRHRSVHATVSEAAAKSVAKQRKIKSHSHSRRKAKQKRADGAATHAGSDGVIAAVAAPKAKQVILELFSGTLNR